MVVFPARHAVPSLRGMATVARTTTPGIFLVTLTTFKLRPVFSVSRLADLFIDTLLELRMHGVFKLHAFLVLPDRVHLLLGPHAPLKRVVEVLETTFAQRLDTVQLVWNTEFESHPVHSIRDLETLRTHIHELPVRAHLTTTAELYPYSSASRLR